MSGIFCLKVRQFCFSAKFCNQTNWRVPISNMTIVFFFFFFEILTQKYPNKTFLVKNTKIKHVWSQIYAFFLFLQKFYNQTNSRLLISNMTVLFSCSSPRILKSDIFSPIFRRFCFLKKFCNYSNFKVLISNMTMVVLKFFPKNTKIRDFW